MLTYNYKVIKLVGIDGLLPFQYDLVNYSKEIPGHFSIFNS